MPNANSGSLALNIFNRISPLPNNVSGALVSIVEEKVFLAEQLTGDSIGTTAIAERYQSPITDLSTATVLQLMGIQDMGVQSVSVGDLTTNNSNFMEMSRQFEQKGIQSLKWLTKGAKYYRTRG